MTTAPLLRRLRLTAATCAAFSAVALALAGTAAAGDVQLNMVKTDNYKASYNAGGAADNRTWLPIENVTIEGKFFSPDSDDDGWVGQGPYHLYGTQMGAPDVLTLSVDRLSGPGNDSPLFRTSGMYPAPFFGPLVMVTDKQALRTTPIRYQLTVKRNYDAVVATFELSYRYEAAFSAPAAGTPQHIEANGPGGRWYVDGVATPMDWENRVAGFACVTCGPATAPAPQPVSAPATTAAPVVAAPGETPAVANTSGAAAGRDAIAPRIVAAVVTRLRDARWVRIKLRATDNVGVAAVRTANEGSGWGRWRAIAPGRPVQHVLARGTGRKVVYIQVRDEAGNISRPLARRA